MSSALPPSDPSQSPPASSPPTSTSPSTSTSTSTSHPQQPQQPPIQDCLPCKLMGGAVFTGLGIYTYISGHAQLRQNVASSQGRLRGLRLRGAGITGIAATLVGAGVWRVLGV